MIPVELLVFFVAVIISATGIAYRNSRIKKLPPGPYQWPLVGNVKELRVLTSKLGGQHKAFLELCRRYGSSVIRMCLGSRNTVIVSGHEAIIGVLTSEDYDGRPWNFFSKMRNMGRKRGITMNDGADWREIRCWFMRSMRSLGFARREMADFIKEELQHEVLDKIGEGGVHQIKPFIISIIINVLWNFCTSRRFDDKKLRYFIELMDRRARAFDMSGGILGAYPWLRFIAPEWSGYNLLVHVNNEFRELLMETITEHKKKHVVGSEADLVDMFLNEMYAGKGPAAGFDEDQLLIILLDVLLAGLNITTLTLDFLFLNILLNQEAQRKLHEEIDREIGREKLPDPADRAKLPYVEAVITESMRLVPVVPIIGPRRVLRDTKLLGYDVPRGTTILINLHAIHADPNLYPEPYSFKPERFLDNGARARDENLLFFGKGRRQCPGVSLAKSALFLVFTGVMQRYQLLPVPGEEPPSLQIEHGITLSPKPYKVLLVPRNKN